MKILFLIALITASLDAEPQPMLSWVYPAGGSRGALVQPVAKGSDFGSDISKVSVWISGKGVSGKAVKFNNEGYIALEINITPDAELGEREIRIITAGGVSNRFRFFIGDVPEILEKEPNNDKAQPQILPALPVLVNGQITDGDRDYFRFHANAGQKLVLNVLGRAIIPFIANAVPGWFDPCITIYDAEGKQVAYADDFRIRPDPVLFFQVPKDGDYTVELRDIIYRGRLDFIYRLSIGELPFVTDIFPLGGPAGTTAHVELHGYNLPKSNITVPLPKEPGRIFIEGLPFQVGSTCEDGRITKPGETHSFNFTVKAGEKMVMETTARRLGSPLDSVLTLYDAKGNQLAENDDWTDPADSPATHHADSRIPYTFASAGTYTLKLRDIQGNFGPEYAYRLSIAPPQPDFALRIVPDNPRLGKGDTAAIIVTPIRKDGFEGEIHLSVEGLPPGFRSSEAVIQNGQEEGRLTITAPPDAPVEIVEPAIYGTAGAIRHRAETAESVMQAFAYTHFMPTARLALSVLQPAAYLLESNLDAGKVLEVKPGTDFPVVIKVKRMADTKGAVNLSTAKIAPGITMKSLYLPADKDEATINISVGGDAKPGVSTNVIIMGVLKSGKETITRYLPAIPIRVVAK